MNLSQQVSSLELSRRLKELGVKQESAFWWCEIIYGVTDKKGHTENTAPQYEIVNSEVAAWNNEHPRLSAFTVAELGEMFPEGFVYHTRIMDTNMGKRRIDPSFQELKKGQPQGNVWKGGVVADTEADARARMMIYLLENNLITMTTSDKLAAIREKCIAANPDAYARGRSIPSIRLADVLYAAFDVTSPIWNRGNVTIDIVERWRLTNDDLAAQSTETLDFLYELLK